MNSFRKNKGIVLELTSLLDVIMIMLFWVMTDVSASIMTMSRAISFFTFLLPPDF